MLQEAGFAKDLTVRETLVMWAGTLTSPRPVEESLAMCSLENRANIRVGSLSGGERRRLDLAMATLGRPELLFMDEPTTGLDPAVRQHTWELVRRMLDEGSTVLLTTHYMEEAEELADRILIMDKGRILTEGSVADIVAQHPCEITFPDVEVSAGLPKFTASHRALLDEQLHSMGMLDAFEPSLADFSPLGSVPDGNLAVGSVIQKTFVDVNEQGTRAAAATSVEMETTAARPSDPEVREVVLNRPFVYLIIDYQSATPLFAGVVTSMA